MTYSLRRTRDGAGDSGGMSLAIIPTYDMDTNKVSNIEYKDNARPEIGAAMRVGSTYARTFGTDWWQTTVITAILEERVEEDGTEYVRFKTGNSEYEWTHR